MLGPDQILQVGVARSRVRRAGRDGAFPGVDGGFGLPGSDFLLRQAHLNGRVVSGQTSRTLQILEVVVAECEVVMRLVNYAPEQECGGESHAERAGTRSRTADPAQAFHEAGAGLAGGGRSASLRVEQEGGDAAFPQLPDSAVEDEVVNVHQGGENQEAAREI